MTNESVSIEVGSSQLAWNLWKITKSPYYMFLFAMNAKFDHFLFLVIINTEYSLDDRQLNDEMNEIHFIPVSCHFRCVYRSTTDVTFPNFRYFFIAYYRRILNICQNYC